MHRFLAAAAPGALLAAALVAADGALPPDVREGARRLSEKAAAGTRAAEWTAGLTDRAGPRLPGSAGDREAVAWALDALRAAGLSNVRAERAPLAAMWRRGVETGEVLSPTRQPLSLTALGGSVGTPAEGVEAEILEVASLEELATRGDAARGKIVFFDRKMERTADGSGYGRAVGVRGSGPSRAARLGAVGVLIRSVGTDHNRLPHTGALAYEAGAPRIPAAALSVPDAELLERLGRSGRPVRVRFLLTCGGAGPGESANVIGEVPGRERPEEIVLLGAHLDSWDLGTGAIDDAAGCGIVIEAARLIHELGAARRTVRVVLFANEENGLDGGKAYAAAHQAELPRHAAALESDLGSDAPRGLGYLAGPSAEAALRETATLLAPLGAGSLTEDAGGSDISVLRASGVPLLGVLQDASRYFDFHHSANDTFDKVDRSSLDRVTAAVAAVAYVAASLPEPLERIPAAKRAGPKE